MPRVHTTRKPRNAFQRVNDSLGSRRRRAGSGSFEAFCLAQQSRLMLNLHETVSDDSEFLGPGDGLGRYTLQRDTQVESRGYTQGCQTSDYSGPRAE